MAQSIPAVNQLSPISIKTTLPRLPYSDYANRAPITTERLLIRSPHPTDLPAIHALRTQPEVMQWTATGLPDSNLDKTRTHLEMWLSSTGARTYNCVIALKDTGEVIGTGGSHIREGDLGWPEVGYMLRKEFWGRGLGTEFLRGFLEAWWGLEREDVVLSVRRDALDVGVKEGDRVEERIVALTVEQNTASRRVLGRVGMELVKFMEEEDAQRPEEKVALFYYTVMDPTKKEE